jgi:hypothetical protein
VNIPGKGEEGRSVVRQRPWMCRRCCRDGLPQRNGKVREVADANPSQAGGCCGPLALPAAGGASGGGTAAGPGRPPRPALPLPGGRRVRADLATGKCKGSLALQERTRPGCATGSRDNTRQERWPLQRATFPTVAGLAGPRRLPGPLFADGRFRTSRRALARRLVGNRFSTGSAPSPGLAGQAVGVGGELGSTDRFIGRPRMRRVRPPHQPAVVVRVARL